MPGGRPRKGGGDGHTAGEGGAVGKAADGQDDRLARGVALVQRHRDTRRASTTRSGDGEAYATASIPRVVPATVPKEKATGSHSMSHV